MSATSWILHPEVHFKSRSAMPEQQELLAIGELARRTATADSALRYYEKLGLLRPAERVRGRRRYKPSSAEDVALVRLCQDAGFTLREIRDFIGRTDRSKRAWSHLAERKIRELDERIADAQRAKQLLQHALDCPSPRLVDCPNFKTAVASRLNPAADTTS
jgi:DNA-binding transcriptional MerR regulator